MNNEHNLTEEQFVKLVHDLHKRGYKKLNDGEYLCTEVNFDCPLCGHGMILIRCGGGFELICKKYGELAYMTGR